MFNLHCTKKLLDRIKPDFEPLCENTTTLGAWYATALFWRPQLVLFVNERTLLPVVMPLAPASSVGQRFPQALSLVLNALAIDEFKIKRELADMSKMVFAKTTNRSVLGVMNQFVFQAEGYRNHFGLVDPLSLSLKLAGTPCSPLYRSAVCPDLAVQHLFAAGLMQ
jgi:hypothetical protein